MPIRKLLTIIGAILLLVLSIYALRNIYNDSSEDNPTSYNSSLGMNTNANILSKFNYSSIKELKIEQLNKRIYAYLSNNIVFSDELKLAIDKGLPVSFVINASIYQKNRFKPNLLLSQGQYRYSISYSIYANRYRLISYEYINSIMNDKVELSGQVKTKEFSFDNQQELLNSIQSINKWYILNTEKLNSQDQFMAKFLLTLDNQNNISQIIQEKQNVSSESISANPQEFIFKIDSP
jgi:Domain of unknown function (DUF4390)